MIEKVWAIDSHPPPLADGGGHKKQNGRPGCLPRQISPCRDYGTEDGIYSCHVRAVVHFDVNLGLMSDLNSMNKNGFLFSRQEYEEKGASDSPRK